MFSSWIRRGLCLALLNAATVSVSLAETIETGACPLFHCTAEATGVIHSPTTVNLLTVTRNDALGAQIGQGCSGDGSSLFCLFSKDTEPGVGKGTLKRLDPVTLQPLWGTQDAANSFNPAADTAAAGQVPLVFASGNIAVGDASVHALYNSAGAVINTLRLAGKGKNYGLTPISYTYGIVSQTDGVLTLVNLSTWQAIGALTLTDPQGNAAMSLVSPSSGSAGVLYAVTVNSRANRGILFAVGIDPATTTLKIRASFAFVGRTGASPVVVTPAVTGFADNLVLLHVPGSTGEASPQNKLLAIADSGTGLTPRWSVPMSQSLAVAPTFDAATRSLFFAYRDSAHLYRHDLASGNALGDYDIGVIGGFPSGFKLNGHLVASQSETLFTLLLSGSVKAKRGSGGGQYVMGFAPAADATALSWVRQIATTPDQYTAAWTTVPSSQAGIACLVVVSASVGVTRLCDF